MSSMNDTIRNKSSNMRRYHASRDREGAEFVIAALCGKLMSNPLPYGRGSFGMMRRGNSIVLVTALLVLLVIIATAYVTRTTAGRVTARAVRSAEAREATAQVLSEMIAQIPADALFVEPVTPLNALAINDATPPTLPADSNDPRLPAHSTLQLYNTVASRYNIDFAYPYNFAPMYDSPFTNWPDAATLTLKLGANYNPAAWPAGPGHPSGGTGGALLSEGNPIGNPGFGDSKWLADFEPVRVDLNNDGILESFSHWRHMTNLSKPNNGFRICIDISDVGNHSIIQDLTLPVEQWLSTPNANIVAASGNTPFIHPAANSVNGWGNWLRWAGTDPATNNYIGLLGTQQVLQAVSVNDRTLIPGNFYKLPDLDADGFYTNWYVGNVSQDTANAEFDFETARNYVNRYLADTDGDGFTDAFWHLVPLPRNDGIMHLVAVRIIPNNAMINVNTSTRFQHADNTTYLQGGAAGPNSRTRGHTASDIGLAGALAPGNTFANLNVGFYDDPLNDALGQDAFDYDPAHWLRHVAYVGMPNGFSGNPGTLNQYQRLDWWRRAGLNPLNANSISNYQPFTLADEIELRMFYGQNYEWVFSRYEHSVQDNSGGTQNFVRAEQGAPETSENAGQLINKSLVLDQRHRITTYSNVRNELLAPWLRYRWFRDVNGDGFIDFNDRASLPIQVQEDIEFALNNPGVGPTPAEIIDTFFAQNRLKLDLREPALVYNPGLGTFAPLFPVNAVGTIAARPGAMSLRERLPLALYHALDDGPRIIGANAVGNTYLGPYSENLALGGPGSIPTTSRLYRIRSMATSLAANILSFRDQDDLIHLSDDPSTTAVVEGPIPLPAVPGLPADDSVQYLGMERQPFITEVFIGHVYSVLEVPDTDADGDPYLPENERVVLHKDSRHSTIVVVQIANPFDRQIDLRQYKISVFGNVYNDLAAEPSPVWLQPSTPENPSTAIFYAMKDDIGNTVNGAFRAKWLDFLDLETSDLPANTIVRRVMTDWPTERDQYDSASDTVDAVTLMRSVEEPPGSGIFVDVVVDRIDKGEGGDDNRDFARAVKALENDRPPDQIADPVDAYDVPPFGAPYQGYPEWSMELPFDHWVQWVRCTRAWGVDLDGDGAYQQDERNPRFVFSERVVVQAAPSAPTSLDYPLPDTSYGLNATGHGGNKYEFAADPDDNGTGTGSNPPPIPWFRRDYVGMYDADNDSNADILTGKPTFFDMKRDGINYNGIPDKGWYSQAGTSSTYSVDDPTIDPANGSKKYRLNIPMQMIQKDGDFEQIGEVLNVWIMGHELQMSCGGAGSPCTYEQTTKTFSEQLATALSEAPLLPNYGQRARVNRLGAGRMTLGVASPTDLVNPLHFVPDQPATVRVMDLFVCDGYGVNPPGDANNNGVADEPIDYELRRFSNANGFSGLPVYGMPNIGVAPPEVLRSMPQWSRMIYESPGTPSRTYIAEAVTQYRDRYDGDPLKPYGYRNMIDINGDGIIDGFNIGPNYGSRDGLWSGISNVRTDRGIASIGEILMMTKSADATDAVDRNRWSAEFAGMNPFTRFPTLNRVTTRLCTDTLEDRSYYASPSFLTNDRVASDAEELNMLFSGVSNIVTTRSDTFTVYFRVRSFKQNPTSGRWDATDPEHIVDDSRYVMLVDRSNCNNPGDKPKILFLEKCPN